MSAATDSPRSKVHKQNSLSTILRKTHWLAVVDTRQKKIRMWLANMGRVASAEQRRISQQQQQRDL